MTPENVAALRRRIQDVLEAGLPQDEQTVRAINASCDPIIPIGPIGLAADPGGGDEAVARALLLYPAEETKIALEPDLERAACSPDDARLTAELLCRSASRAAAVFPDGSRLDLALEPEDARTFVRRLRPECNPPGVLREILDTRFDPGMATRLKVVLRHAPVALGEAGAGFMRSLLAGTRATDGALVELTVFALRFWEGLAPVQTPEQGLARRWRTLAAQLKQAERQHDALDQSSFEIMISQGARLPHLHEESLRRELALLTLIARAIGLGGAGALSGGVDRDLGASEDAEGLIARLCGLDDVL
ncbi:MAG: hypothetical protein HQK81_14390 [Desulfovibrionaceae bacterium]|nr:hypothetical protein [Desulfovibrionaceae bacterium]MBF0515233.1 hypothetical protein [Desulfovibrionaceae bacterium]